MDAEDLESYENELEFSLYRKYHDVASLFSYVVETERRFYLANAVDVQVRTSGGEVFFEPTLGDVWAWDIYRASRFVKSVHVVTFKDANVEELTRLEMDTPFSQRPSHAAPPQKAPFGCPSPLAGDHSSSSDSVFHKTGRTMTRAGRSDLTLVAEVIGMAEQVVAATRGRTVIAAGCDDHVLTLPFQGLVGAGAVRAGASCQSTGRRGEDLAATYLEDIGWQILERNWRPNHGLRGELDIIALEPDHAHREPGSESVTDPAQGWAGAKLVIVEVKTHSSLCQGPSAAAVDARKVTQLRALATAWASTHETPPHTGMHLDVVSIPIHGAHPTLLHHHQAVSVSWDQLMRLLRR